MSYCFSRRSILKIIAEDTLKRKREMEMKEFRLTEHYQNMIQVGKGHLPAYLLNHSRPILFDPGISAFGPFYLQKLSEILKGNYESPLLLLTHSHFDHCGAAPYLLRKFSGTKIGASTKAIEVFNKQSAINLIKRLNSEYENNMKNQLEGENVTFTAINVDYHLKEGDKIEWTPGKFIQVIETPGHTRDSLSYLFLDSGILVAGESAGVLEENYIHSTFLSSYEDYLRSIEKLQTLNAEAICIAHAGIITGSKNVRTYLQASLQASEDYRRKIESYLKKYEGDQEKIIKIITEEEYDSKTHHIINRTPFILNLQAKINAIAILSRGSRF